MKGSSSCDYEGFVKVISFRIKHVEISEYLSLSTGLRVFFMQYETPIVNTYIVVPTREETDQGLPHTLEHLIFLGSKNHPIRGILDLVSMKSLSSGTNAWTSTDHTAYTLSTAGIDGTMQMLPIYLDHVLRPLLTEIAFMTDVHHVTADGSSSGVVYSEMKSRENHSDELMFFEVLDKLYPGDSGYKRNTGGKLSALRSTSIDRVREFHKTYYKWSNLSVVICGDILDPKSVLSLLNEQQKLINNTTNEEMANGERLNKKFKTGDLKHFYENRFRVWNDEKHVRKLAKSTVSTIYFPCDEEECGTFTMSWRGPPWEEFELIRAISLMGSYLVDSTASPLEKALIHTDNPYGSCVDFSIELFKETYFQLTVKDVPLTKNAKNASEDKMQVLGDKVKSLLENIYKGEFDMERMRMLIKRCYHNYLRQIETSAHDTLIENVIGYIIYGSKEEQLEKIIVDQDLVKNLSEKDEKYWKELLLKYFIEPPSVSVKCMPSLERSKEIEKEEKELMKNQLKKYGKEQLKKNKEMVDEDLKRNNNGPPVDILDQYKQCDSTLIKLPKYPLYRNFDFKPKNNTDNIVDNFNNNMVHAEINHDFDEDKMKRRNQLDSYKDQLEKIKFPLQVNNIPSDFVRIYLIFSTCKLDLTAKEKKLMFLLCVLLFESDVRFGDRLMKSEELIKTLMENTTSYGCNLGLSSSSVLPDPYSELVTLHFTCPTENYDKLLEIMYNIFYNVEYTKDILTNHVKSLLNSFSKKKRSAKTMLKQLSNYLKVDNDSVRYLCSLGQQDQMFKNLMADPEGPVRLEKELKSLHQKIFNIENISVHITADLSKLQKNWLDFWVKLSESSFKNEVKHEYKHEIPSRQSGEKVVLNEYFGLKYGNDKKLKNETGILSSLASTDVSYLSVVVPAPYGYNHEDYFPVLTACEYLTMTEGLVYRAIRGGGYAYHHRFSYSPSQGEIQMFITEATDLVMALKVTRECLFKYTDPEFDIEKEMSAAKSSLIYRILSNEESLADYSQETYTSALRQTDVDFNKYSVAQIQELGVEKIREAFKKYFTPFLEFSGPPKIMSCIASKSDAKTIYKGFKTVKYHNIQQLESKSLLSLLASSAEAQEN